MEFKGLLVQKPEIWAQAPVASAISTSQNQLWWALLLLLRRFSLVRLCATPETAAHQAPPSLGFSRQEYWSGVPVPSPKLTLPTLLNRAKDHTEQHSTKTVTSKNVH